ncbi:NAD kinase [Consotaella aegiceratis]|uniref:NAD kinase n=1 Tax=Consotaella aegiceratis TaxID=3097961 RepID=UPI002F3FE7F8
MHSRLPSVSFLASRAPEARTAAKQLAALYGNDRPEEADVVVALGGDGFMLQVLHRFMGSGKPIYGMNKGTVGFMMNEFREMGLKERLAVAVETAIHPLEMIAIDDQGVEHKSLAINEVSLLRQSYQAARLQIDIDGHTRLEELVCDGVMVATPIGSTAYNLSAQGPIIPIDAPLLALTPVCPFRPRRWRGALLPNHQEVQITVLEAKKRPVTAFADHAEVRKISSVIVRETSDVTSLILFDPEHSWEERILAEQFRY